MKPRPLIASPAWTAEEEARLRDLALSSGMSVAEIGNQLGRTKKAIQGRLHKLGIQMKRIKLGRRMEGKAAPSERLAAARSYASTGTKADGK
jgi:hypothetical protein